MSNYANKEKHIIILYFKLYVVEGYNRFLRKCIYGYFAFNIMTILYVLGAFKNKTLVPVSGDFH